MSVICNTIYYFVCGRLFQMTWISIVLYSFTNTFIYYMDAPQFCYLRAILGSGLCISRGTASVINMSCALVLLPMCKRLNRIIYRMLSKLCPAVFFFWLENAKSFHMTVATTIVIFAVIHSISHFVNLWNFSRHYDEANVDINFAAYKNQNPVELVLSPAVGSGLLLLLLALLLAGGSGRRVRTAHYNVFWYTHQAYLPFLVLLIVHPLSGVLKEQVMPHGASLDCHKLNATLLEKPPVFVAIKSKTWLWMALPLTCFMVDLIWRMCSRNLATVDILEVRRMAGRTLALRLRGGTAPAEGGQYVLLQCAQLSALEWHPFTVVKLPTESDRSFHVWVRAGGDWTRALETLLLRRGPTAVTLRADGPYCSPLQAARRARLALCVAAGVGVTPFVTLLRDLCEFPNNRLPKRVHLIWIVRTEIELTWVAELANKTMRRLRDLNKPDRLQLELYVTNSGRDPIDHIVVMNGGAVKHITKKHRYLKEEEETLLTPVMRRDDKNNGYVGFSIAERYPLLGCRVKSGRPHWDRLFGYWAQLYPDQKLSLFCCGPKKLVKELRSKSLRTSRTTSTSITFVHEGFS